MVDPEKKLIAVCLPVEGSMKALTGFDLMALTQWTARNRPDISMVPITRSGILPDNRNWITRAALEGPATHLFWLDSDMRFPKDALARLVDWNEPIVGTNYITRKLPPRPTAKMLAQDGISFVDYPIARGATGLERVDVIGFGCVLIRSDVFRKLPEPWFHMPWVSTDLMHCGEDGWFCLQAAEAGYKVLIDRGLSRELRHIGEIEISWDEYDAVQQHDQLRSGLIQMTPKQINQFNSPSTDQELADALQTVTRELGPLNTPKPRIIIDED